MGSVNDEARRRAMSEEIHSGLAGRPEHREAEAALSLEGRVEVYDPAMCCSTGMCGPGVDPALLTISRDLRWVEKQGATVERFGLAQEPQAFVSSRRVAGLMEAFGDGALPAVIVNETVLCHGRYPTREEIVAALTRRCIEVTGSAGCSPGSGCC
jgi:hypothetical protein